MRWTGYVGSYASQPAFSKDPGGFDPAFGFNIYVDRRGYPWPPSATEAFLEAFEAYQPDPTDVTVNGFPKSGTNWMQIMMANLYTDWGTTKISANGAVPQLDILNNVQFEGFECCLAGAHPRLTKAHVAVDRMPAAFREAGIGKVIHIYRNPKDSCVSYFHELRAYPTMDFRLTLEEWVTNYIAGKVPFGSWLEHLLGWYAREDVLSMSYEDVSNDPFTALQRASVFIGRPVSDEHIRAVVEMTEFDTMKSSGLKKQLNIGLHDETVSPFMRTGKSGGWRNVLSAEQSDMIDAAWGPSLARAGIRFADM